MRAMNREALASLVLAAGLLVVPLIALGLDDPFIVTLATKVAILALAGAGLNLALGFGGLVSFGHAAFFGLGGYAASILASHALNYEPVFVWPFEISGTTSMPVIWLVAMVAGAIAAAAIGALSLRTGGVYFIMITLAFAQMIYYFAISWPAYGGEDGLSIYVRDSFPGLNTLDPLQFFLICYVVLMVALAFCFVLTRSRFGLALQAARQNATRLAAVGIEPFGIRLMAFAISGAITALAGALYADLNRFVSPAMLNWHTSGEIMVFVILGGVGRIFGPVAGAALYIVLEHNLGGLTEYWQLPLGLLLLAVVLYARGGILGLVSRQVRHG
jgi:branched-chain amino acid transport system permease protein